MIKKVYTTLIIGTGFSGLAMAIKLKDEGITDFHMLEKAKDIGGTWRENTYPGAECDIPSALYSYSFEPYPEWEYKWSMQPQILEYINHVANKYEIKPHISFNKELSRAIWKEQEKLWEIGTTDGSTYYTKTLVTAVGQLHHPSIPDFKGKEVFEGSSFHSAQWDHSLSLKNKKVGVIGNAASAVQFIPEIAKIAGEVKIFQRSANWMLPKLDRAYKEWEKSLVRKMPLLLKLYRQNIWLKGGALFPMMKQGNNWLRSIIQFRCKRFIKDHIKDPETVDKLIPTYPLGAKRVLFSDTYYPALAQPHVHVIDESIDHINARGVQTKLGAQHDVDILIYATGFKTNPFLFNLDIQGKNGISLKKHWKNGPTNYLGITIDQFPNLFMMYGPNTNLGHNSIIIMSEAQAAYISQCVKQVYDQTCTAIEVKKDILTAYHTETQSRLNKMIWNTIDKSWYKSENGNIPNNWPGRTMEYCRRTKQVQWDDFILSD